MDKPHPNRPPQRLIDKVVVAVLASAWFRAIWHRVGSPVISIKMPPQRLPDGSKGYRVISLR